MSLSYNLRYKRYLSFTGAQWLLMIFVIAIILVVINSIIQGMNAEPPPIKRTIGDGAVGEFDGGRNLFFADGVSPEKKAQGCYRNDSRIHFYNGEINLDDGSTIVVGEEGSLLVGEICLQSVDSYIWSSTDLRHRTPVAFQFEGYIEQMPFIDYGLMFPYFGWAVTLLIVMGLLYRKIKPTEFDADMAEDIFSEYVSLQGYEPAGPIESEEDEVSGGTQYIVSQKIKTKNGTKTLIRTIDNHKKIHNKRLDDTGEIFRERMGRKQLEFNKEMRKGIAKYSDTDVDDLATQRLQNYFNEKKMLSDEEKARRTRDYLSRDQTQPQYKVNDGADGLENEE